MNKKALKILLFATIGLITTIALFESFPLPPSYHPESEVSTLETPSKEGVSKVISPMDVSKGNTSEKSFSSTAKEAENTAYPLHTNITATVFWVGEPVGNGSSEDNALSAWDDLWQEHYGCFDDPINRNVYYPKGCLPKENPFYFDLPYNDFDWDIGDGRRADAYMVVPWAKEKIWGEEESMLKNRWIKIMRGSATCYGQWEDSGPYAYDDVRYVFGKNDERPKNTDANNAGMDVSPALRDCLKFEGLNNDQNKVSWRFVDGKDVPAGPWKEVITISQTYWK